MHAVIRTYTGEGATQLFDLLVEHKDEVERLMRTVHGFVSYSLIRTGEGGVTITSCLDKAGTDESVRMAKDWIGQNGSEIGALAPAVSEGPLIIQSH